MLAVIVSIVAAGLALTCLELARSRARLAATMSAALAERDAEIDALRQRVGPAAPFRAPGPASWAFKAVVDTAARVRERGIIDGLVVGGIEEITRWATEDREQLEALVGPDGSLTVLFTDIENSTRLNEELGDAGWLEVLTAHDSIVRRRLTRHSGHIVKSQGDGFMVVFTTADEAVAAAQEIQSAVGSPGRAGARRLGSAARQLRRTPLRVRIGVHTGEVVARDGDYFGRNVAKAARIAALADGAEILMSAETQQSLTRPPATLCPWDEVELKGLAGTHVLWQIPAAPVAPAGPARQDGWR